MRFAILLAWLALTGAQTPRGDLLVSITGEHRVALFDTAGGRQVASFPADNGPHEIVLSPDGRYAYAANSGTGPSAKPGEAVTAIDLRSGSVRQMKTTPHAQPHDVRVSRDGRLIWVAASPSKAILEMDASTGSLARTFGTEREGGWFVVVTPDNTKFYVPLLEGKGLAMIDRARGSSRIVVDGGAFSGTEVSPDGREVWAVAHETGHIVVLSTASDEVIARIPLEQATFGRLQFTPDGRRAFVVQDSRLLAFDTATRRPAGSLALPFPGKVLAIDAQGRHGAVTHPSDDKVSLIDLARMSVVRTFATGKSPDGVAWVPTAR